MDFGNNRSITIADHNQRKINMISQIININHSPGVKSKQNNSGVTLLYNSSLSRGAQCDIATFSI